MWRPSYLACPEAGGVLEDAIAALEARAAKAREDAEAEIARLRTGYTEQAERNAVAGFIEDNGKTILVGGACAFLLWKVLR